MGKPDWDKIADLIAICSEHQEKNNVDSLLWGDCFNCPVEDSCPNFNGSIKKEAHESN